MCFHSKSKYVLQTSASSKLLATATRFPPFCILVNPFTREEFVPDVKEGQTITFPSYVVHKSPDDFFKERKTIISWNSDIDIEHPYTP